jgi:hypothetical protein
MAGEQPFNGGDNTVVNKKTDLSSVAKQRDLVALEKGIKEATTRETFIEALRLIDSVPSSTGIEISTEEIITIFNQLDQMTPEEGAFIFKSKENLGIVLKNVFGVTNTFHIRDKMIELLSVHIQG